MLFLSGVWWKMITDMIDSGLIMIIYEGKTNMDIELVI